MSLYGETLFTMRGQVRNSKPNCSGPSIDGFLNDRVRDVITRKTWSDSIKTGTIMLPNQYATGTVTVTPGSDVVAGTGTAWPINDEVNTSCPNPVRQPGYSFIQPASMVGIAPGKWLVVDMGVPVAQETIVVESVSGKGFFALCSETHDAGFTIQKSSLANRQFRTNYPVFTIRAVIDAQTIWLELPWAAPQQVNTSYQIIAAFVSPSPYTRRILYAWDPLQGIALDVNNWTYEQILVGDTQLTSTDNPTMLVNAPTGAGGVPLWFVYPPQASIRQIPVVYTSVWPKMIQDNDIPPSFLNPGIFVAGGIADALKTRTITQNMKQDPYFDVQLAQTYEERFERLIDMADQEDQGRRNDRLQNYVLMAQGMYSASYVQGHPGWPTEYGSSWR